ncbi:hypothetical protein NC652_027777 [Populus alba x Populus x berolinensis]|nr:hypothetical protein NC652_027777 [Populus alba x Populus x berolinensis]
MATAESLVAQIQGLSSNAVISSRGVQNNIDILSLSYTRHAEDVRHVPDSLFVMHFFHGLTYFDEILQEADGVILSRGNLGIDLPPEKVFLFQKTVVFKCNMAGKPAVVTLVVDSMTENLRPPRAEATNVANAILDASYTSESVILLLIAVPHSSSLVRSNAILLGAETLRGLYPVETFSTVGRICAEAFSLLNESPRIQYYAQTVVAALASDPNVWNAVWENKALQELLQSQNANKEYVADNESVGDTDSQDAAVSSKKLTELSDDENETGNSQTGLMDVINNVKLTVVDMVTNVSAYFKKIFSFSSAEHTPDAADEKAGSSTTEKTLGASLMALAVMVVTAPMSSINAIAVEAFKKYILFSTSLPKYTSSAAQRSLKTLCQPYMEVASSYSIGKVSELKTYIQTNTEKFESDNNLGLVKQVISSMYKRNIQRLTQTYWTLSVQDIAKNVQLSSPKEAEMHVLQMIEDGEIYATINQKDGMAVKKGDTIFVGQYLFTGNETTSVWLEASSFIAACHVTYFSCQVAEVNGEYVVCLVISSRGVQNNIDILSLSYTRHAEDVRHAREFLSKLLDLYQTQIFAKIEIVELTYFDESLQEADGVILSRGNLGIDLPPEKVFLFQKTVVFKCNMAGKPAVVTLVVDSMTENLRPPRAEATNVANAILDASYTSESVILLLIAVPHSSSLVRINAILLGAETLRGLYPVETFSTVGRICAEAFSLLNESPRIQYYAQTVVAALASDPNVWNAVWENKALQELLQSQNANKEYVADNESVGDTDSQDAAVSSKKLTELSDDENETGNSQTGLMDVINNVKLTVVDMVTNVSAYFKKIFSFSSAEHTRDAADENTGSSTTEKTLGASLMALAVMVVTAPMSSINAIAVEAFKKYILFSTSLPKYTSSAAQRSLKTLCQPYMEVASSYSSGKVSELKTYIQTNKEKFESDNNLGLVKQVISSMYKRNIQRLTQTYWTLSVQDIAKNVQLSSPKEAEMHVLQMIEDGEIYATINQKDGMAVKKGDTIFVGQYLFTGNKTTSLWDLWLLSR